MGQKLPGTPLLCDAVPAAEDTKAELGQGAWLRDFGENPHQTSNAIISNNY